MLDVTTWLDTQLGLGLALQGRLFATVAAILCLWLGRQFMLWLLFRRVTAKRARYQWRKVTRYVVAAAAVLIIGRIWSEGFQALITFVGLLTAALAIALQSLIANLAGWVYILVRRPFAVGHRIQVGEHVGDVIDLGILEFTILEVGNWVDANQSTGRVIHIPNSRSFTLPVANSTQGFNYLWIELPVLLTFDSNWERAKRLLTEVAQEIGRDVSTRAEQQGVDDESRFLIHYRTFTPRVYTSVTEKGVLLTMRLLAEPRSERLMQEAAWEAVLRTFAGCDDIALANSGRLIVSAPTESGAEPPAGPVSQGGR